jgi:microcin C transport system substrate-binding protein
MRSRSVVPYLLMMMLVALPAVRGEDAFDPKGWTTCESYPPIGDPRAKRDVKDAFVYVWQSFPPTLRTDGPNSNESELSIVHNLMFETLVQIHPETEEFIPLLATHWKIETDEKSGKQTFTFHLNPKAKFADGSPVTADDVVASFWHRVQEDRDDPSNVLVFGDGYEMPTALDKLTVQVKTKKQGWRLFLYFSGMTIFPAKEVKIPGKQYLDEYNWKFMTGSGPYKLASPDDLKKGDSLTVTRRNDWWAENEPWAKNTYNFAKAKFLTVSEEELTYQMFKKGDVDSYQVTIAKRWVQDYPNEDVVKKGWVKRRKIFNQAPRGFSGLAFNMREKPFDDKRVRRAFCHLFNRERLIEKLFLNQYDFLNSYEPGRDWGNEAENPPTTFDPEQAAKLLAEAGFKNRDASGFLVGPDGKELEVTLTIPPMPSLERIFLVVKEDYEKGGVKFNLKQLDQSTIIKNVSERQFKIHYQSWGSLLFPNPERRGWARSPTSRRTTTSPASRTRASTSSARSTTSRSTAPSRRRSSARSTSSSTTSIRTRSAGTRTTTGSSTGTSSATPTRT